MATGVVVFGVLLSAWCYGEEVHQQREGKSMVDMPLGVDDAGSRTPIWTDKAAQDAYRAMGFDFLSFHLYPQTSQENLRALDGWARETGTQYVLNQEGAERRAGAPEIFPSAGAFYQPDRSVLAPCLDSPRWLGMVYDELDHCVTNGGWPTVMRREYAPYFYDAKGRTLDEAYDGNLRNAEMLMSRMYPGFRENGRGDGRGPVVGGENVFPILDHLFARAGIVPIPKYLKETVTPVQAAVAMGAAKQYGTQYWACLDLWFTEYPGHPPFELTSALHLAYWTGADRAYVENFHYQDSLYKETPEGIRLTQWGEAVRAFRREYLPAHRRTISMRDFAPEIVIVRFPDSDWGQEPTGTWITGWLYGSPTLHRDEQTSDWIRIWNVLTHGKLVPIALNYNNTRLPRPYRFFYPANNVAVYDHLAADPKLFSRARLVLLSGKRISLECMGTLRRLVAEKGLTVVTPSHLAPGGLGRTGGIYAVHAEGSGRWIVTDAVDAPEVVKQLDPYLGKADELRYVFGETQVVFRQPAPDAPVTVEVSKLAASAVP